ncbi:MAG: glycosyltransferase family 39 protein [Candidatus Krumholzibacteria bacterium]|nr:glycosyltransferase family 39 protein [Candidatus Krumholzibacteria bacterium]
MLRNRRASLLLGMLLVILVYHIAVSRQDIGTLARNGFLYDDSFYAFQIARNLSAGNGMTFDGIHPTTGFQPLYVFLLVPAFMASGADPVLPIYAALMMLAVFTTLTALLVFAIAKRYVGRSASFAAAAIWAFSPVVTKQAANGLETALAALMIALSVWYYVERVRPLDHPSPGRLLILGLLLGLTVLSRIDGLFLVLAILLDSLLLLRGRADGAASLAHLLLVPMGVLVCYGPWLAVNMAQTGSPLQDSGAATRFLSLAYSRYFHYGPADLSATGPNSAFIMTHIVHSLSTLKVIPPVHVLFRSLEKLGAHIGAIGAARVLGDVAGGILLMAAAAALVRWRRDPRKSRRRELDFLLLFSLLLMLSYSLYVFGSFFYLRYYYPVYLGACIYLAFFLQDAADLIRRRSIAVRRIAVAGAAVYSVLFGCFTFSQAFRSYPIYPFYDIARWVERNTGRNETIGAFQCGMIGYFADRRVINLDGKVNRDAYAALRSGCLDEYLCNEGIDVVLDHEQIIGIFLDLEPDSTGNPCTRLPDGSMRHPTGWVAYRLPSAGENGETGVGAGAERPAGLYPAR